ncbi:caspase family protein [Criblamydia sequanensis]|uniref:Secreted protein n=1 Tax=Candidatus Criblamydia sequanensis CRIB-18 TaxID=1437425 RepID=A0A090DV16_9BACT|nr:caspase family protein [Criblamydia sequanensis]CDR32859.1 putative secreted protein [Criblamydia sequanensis CRIB-18]
MKNYYLLYLLTFLNFFFHPLQSQEFIAVLIGDTLDDSIGNSVQLDLKRMEKKVDALAKKLEITLKKTIIKDDAFQSDTLIEILSKVEVNEDDLVFIYYSGHGYRSDSTETPWPNIALKNEWRGISHHALTEVFLNKKPFFLLSIADACNNVIPDEWAPILLKTKALSSTKHEKENLKKLFLNQSLFIMASGSSPTYFSYCNDYVGGFFSSTLLKNIDLALSSNQEPDWYLILAKTKAELEDMQKPQYEIIPLN